MAQNGPACLVAGAGRDLSNASSTTALGQEALGWLAELIKINTTNPPGNEEAAGRNISPHLTERRN